MRRYNSTRAFAIVGILLASAGRRNVEPHVYVQTLWTEPTSGGKSSSRGAHQGARDEAPSYGRPETLEARARGGDRRPRFRSGFALGSYSDLLKQAATNLRIVLGLGGAVSDVDADNAAYGKGDYTTALRLLRPLADQNDARAQSTIGEMYYHGRDVPQDDSEAIRWFRLAAGQGSAPARFHLGVAYAGGHGVPQDYSEAAKWYRLAADQGYAPAMYNLGLAYAKGEGVSLDNVSAHMWFNLAASSFPASPPDSLQYLQRTARLNRRGVRFEIFSCR